MGSRGEVERGPGRWLSCALLLLACGADGGRMPPADDGREEPVRTRWPELPAVRIAPRPPAPAGPDQPDPRWALLYDLAHPDPLVRMEAVERSAPHAKDALVRARLLELFDDPDPDVAADAMATLGTDDPAVRERLFVVMRDRRGRPKQVAAHLLIHSGELRGRWYRFAHSVVQGPERVIYVY